MKTPNPPYRSILFVCDVNTCRSPMAEALLKRMLADLDGEGSKVRVRSGGIAIRARDGGAVSLDSRLLMKDEGAESFLDDFRSKDLNRHPDLVEEADLILTMTDLQKEKIRNMEEARGKEIHTLKEFAGEIGDIEDPGGQSEEVYLRCKEEIKRCLVKAIPRLWPSAPSGGSHFPPLSPPNGRNDS